MSKPEKTKQCQVYVRMPPALKKKVEQAAAVAEQSECAFVRSVLKAYFETKEAKR